MLPDGTGTSSEEQSTDAAVLGPAIAVPVSIFLGASQKGEKGYRTKQTLSTC